LFFNDTLTDQVARLAPYASHNITRALNNEDGIFIGQGGISSLLSVKLIDENIGFQGGMVASIILGINSSTIRDPVSGGGDRPPPPPSVPTSTLRSKGIATTIIDSACILFHFVLLFLY
jgi:hypothetical protein